MFYNTLMKDFIPFYTKDGSIGLYSKKDKDIYHSVYGAYSEACDKFVLPAGFETYFLENKNIRILDLCYGIGYNTKAFLNYFLKFNENPSRYIEQIYTDNKNKDICIDTIGDDNIKQEKYINSIDVDNMLNKDYIETIYTNNIFTKINRIFYKNKKNEKFREVKKQKINFENFENYKKVLNKNFKKSIKDIKGHNIKIDAVDINETLVKLSPFLKERKPLFNKYKKTGIDKIDKYMESSGDILKKHKMSREVDIIIAMSVADSFKTGLFSGIDELFAQKDLKYFLSPHMRSFLTCYEINKYSFKSDSIKLHFLHNIYYRYLSYRYKNALKLLQNNDIQIEYHIEDARKFLTEQKEGYDFIFLDAFSPNLCPSLWTFDFFKILYTFLNPNGKIITYSNSAAVRNAMIKNNFYVGKIFNKNENKFTGTVAVKNPDLIKYKLTEFESGLLKTNAGIVYRDKKLSLSNDEIIKLREEEIKKSNLMSSTNYIKMNKKGECNEI